LERGGVEDPPQHAEKLWGFGLIPLDWFTKHLGLVFDTAALRKQRHGAGSEFRIQAAHEPRQRGTPNGGF